MLLLVSTILIFVVLVETVLLSIVMIERRLERETFRIALRDMHKEFYDLGTKLIETEHKLRDARALLAANQYTVVRMASPDRCRGFHVHSWNESERSWVCKECGLPVSTPRNGKVIDG